MIKRIILLMVITAFFGCASIGELYERGKYTETVCTKKLFKKEICKEVTKTGLYVTKKMKVKGTAAKFGFKDGEETAAGSNFWPDISGLQLKNQ